MNVVMEIARRRTKGHCDIVRKRNRKRKSVDCCSVGSRNVSAMNERSELRIAYTASVTSPWRVARFDFYVGPGRAAFSIALGTVLMWLRTQSGRPTVP